MQIISFLCIVRWAILFVVFTEQYESCSRSGNPLFEGWYADPEGVVFDNRYWIFPTYSAPFEQQLFLDAFSSPDLVTWKSTPKFFR